MSKFFDATCDANGKVSVEGYEVTGAVVLSEGKQASSGLLLLDKGVARYVPSSATDIKTTIEKTIATIDDLTAALTDIATALTSLAAVPVGSWAPPPTLATSATTITTKVTSLSAIKSQLTTLKGALK